MDSYSKTIVINSPAGSGGIFCRELIRGNIESEIVWPRHRAMGFQKDDINICLIRDPYDVIASAVEVGFEEVPEEVKDFYNNDEDTMIYDQMIWHLMKYFRFLNLAQRMDYITPVSFKFLTEEPDKFLESIAEKFELNFKANRLSVEDVKTNIRNEKEHMTRVPRDKTDFRKKIDEVVRNYEPIKLAHEEYVRVINSINDKI